MATKISWCNETINPIVGCSKISEGCQNCYAENMAARLASMGFGQYQSVTSFRRWNGLTAFVETENKKPFKWKKSRTIFVSSMGDLFHNTVPFEWVDQIMRMIWQLQDRHTFIVLTKRPDRMLEYFSGLAESFRGQSTERLLGYADAPTLQAFASIRGIYANGKALKNLVLGVTAEDQKTADDRICTLLQISAVKRFVSIEPMLGPVDLYRGGWSFLNALHTPTGNKNGWKRGLDGVIVGGESGNKARLLNPQWVRLVRDQCDAAGVSFMFKQWGKNVLQENNRPWEYNFANGFPDLDGKEHSALAW